MLETHAQRAATIGLTIRHNPTYPFQAQGQTLLNREGSFHTITMIAITHTEAPRYASSPTHAQAQQHLFEIVTPIFAMP